MKKESECVDLVDSSGRIQRRNIPRTNVETYPDLHMQIVIGVIFDFQDRILVHKRARTKSVNPGDIDHVCGGVMAGETPEEALIREAKEETGIHPTHLIRVDAGLNSYKRYRYLLIGEAEGKLGSVDSSEVEWVQFVPYDELLAKQQSGEWTFVDEFFEDTQRVIHARAQNAS